MLSILDALKECGDTLPLVDQYLFFFLKFIQSVVPTLEYDYTIDVQARGSTTDEEEVHAESTTAASKFPGNEKWIDGTT